MTHRSGTGGWGAQPKSLTPTTNGDVMLPFEARQVLLRLEMVSSGPAQSLDAEGGRSSERPSRPSGPADRDDEIPFLYWRRRMLAEPHRMGELIGLAEEALERLLRSPDPVEIVPEERKDMEERMLKTGEGFSVDQVLLHFRELTRRQVIALRASNGRSVEDGRLLREPVDSVEDRLERALRMRGEGLSYRQAQMMTGVPRQTICDAEKKKAA